MRARRPAPAAAPLALAVLLTAAAAPAQDDAPPVLPPPTVLPQAAPAPAPPDTATAAVVTVAGDPDLASLAVVPDTVTFGAVAWIVAGAPGGAPADSLVLPAWLEPAADAGPPPAAAGGEDRLAAPVRVYRVDPFRLAAGGRVSPVVTVRGLGTDGSQTAPVRDPRDLGWNAGVLAAAILGGVLAALLARALWRRRRGPRPRPADRPVPGAAWPGTAVALADLLDRLERDGDGRAFLHGLAALARAHAARRFGIAGREMTGRELADACRRLGYPVAAGRAFGRLLEDLDARRYDPAPVDAAWCRARAADLLAAVAAVRVEPGPTALPADELAAGRAAWRRLDADLGRPGGEAA